MVFSNKIGTTKRALGHGVVEEQMLEGGQSLHRIASQIHLTI